MRGGNAILPWFSGPTSPFGAAALLGGHVAVTEFSYPSVCFRAIFGDLLICFNIFINLSILITGRERFIVIFRILLSTFMYLFLQSNVRIIV